MNNRKSFCIRNIFNGIAAVFGMYLCVAYASECTEGIRKGIRFCIEALVPALFLPMALSSYIIRSGVANRLTNPLGGVSRLLFRLPSQSLAVIFLSAVGGYPVGARCAAMMADQGRLSTGQAVKTAYIAVCAGPGFLINYVGASLLHNEQSGFLLLSAELIGLLTTGVLIGRMVKSAETAGAVRDTPPQAHLLIRSVGDASRASFHMCGMVIVCAAATEIIFSAVPIPPVADVIAAATEITTGCCRMCGGYPLTVIAFFIGFGGVSVHLQIFAGVGSLPLRKGLFILFRILQGITTALAAYILLMIFPIEQSVFNSVDTSLTAAKSATVYGSAALVLSSLCFLGNIHRANGRQRSF